MVVESIARDEGGSSGGTSARCEETPLTATRPQADRLICILHRWIGAEETEERHREYREYREGKLEQVKERRPQERVPV